MPAEVALRYNENRCSRITHTTTEVQSLSRKKGGKRKMKTGQRRIEIVPLWLDQPDARLFAMAVVEMARKRLQAAEEQERQVKEGDGD